MNILVLFPYAPLPPPLDLAGTKRNLPFLLELAKYNDVSVLTYGTSEQEELFKKSYGTLFKDICFVDNKRPRLLNGLERLWFLGTGRSSYRQIYRWKMQKAIDRMTATRRYDVIHCCVQMFGYFKFPVEIPATSDTHEVKYDLLLRSAKVTRNLFYKLFTFLSYRLGKKEEIELCKKFDLLITTTQRDYDLFKKDLPLQKMVVIQNGAGKSFFEKLPIEPEPFTMVFTGLFTHLPNSEGILWFLDEIFPKILEQEPKSRIYIVGKSPGKELLSRSSANVIITGYVDDVRPYMAKSQVFVIPLRAGGGIRGKALEAMAMQRPIVTTTIGVEGIHLFHEESALFADSPKDFANAVVRFFRDPSLCRRIAEKAFHVVCEKYDWEAKGKELDSALRLAVDHKVNAIPHKRRYTT